jgi:hypothetical protein
MITAAALLAVVALTGCTGPRRPALTAATPTSEAPGDVIEVPQPTPTSQPVVTVTLMGTDAMFTWISPGGNMHQIGPQDGPVTYTFAYYPLSKSIVSANVVAMKNRDAACKVTLPDGRVAIENTQPGQTMASCNGTVH